MQIDGRLLWLGPDSVANGVAESRKLKATRNLLGWQSFRLQTCGLERDLVALPHLPSTRRGSNPNPRTTNPNHQLEVTSIYQLKGRVISKKRPCLFHPTSPHAHLLCLPRGGSGWHTHDLRGCMKSPFLTKGHEWPGKKGPLYFPLV